MKYTIITINANNTRDEYTTRSLKEAQRIYDNAVNNGIYVEKFCTAYGTDLRDREQAAIGYTTN